MGPSRDFERWRPHPWHGLPVGPEPPHRVHAYVEITPFDLVKYEIDKATGYLRVDRPQRTSSLPPTLYGFVPRTWCARRVGALSAPGRPGDGDPLDICVVSERPIDRGEIVLDARVVGGIHMVDGGEADDKIVAVLENDDVHGRARELDDLPSALVQRLRHYFATYKLAPGEPAQVAVEGAYGSEHACRVVEAAMQDYAEGWGAGARSTD